MQRARARRLGWLAAVVLGAAAWSLAGPATAQKDADDKALEKSIEETLRKVIDLGANIYNKQSDYNGCFRLYEGALLTLRPVLIKYPELQKAIDSAIDQAYTLVRVDERAHALRTVLGTIRMQFNPALRPADGDKKGDAKDDKKTEEKKDDKKKEKLPDPSLAQVVGHVTVSGKPVVSGHVILIGADGGRSSAKIQKDGTYSLAPGIPPGEYTVVIEEGPPPPGELATPIPEKYLKAATSGLRLTAVKGGQDYNLDLK
jgi:hypothetical protein